MNRIVKICRSGLLLGLAFGASGIGSANVAEASAPAGFWTYTRNVTPGTYYAVMTEVASTSCSLTKVAMSELSSPGNRARCEVLQQNGRWVLETSLDAASSGGNRARVSCSATCFND